MTEPGVGIVGPHQHRVHDPRDGDGYLVNGHKWYITGASDPRCEVFLFFGLSDAGAPRHARHSLILVPARAPGVDGRAQHARAGLRRRARPGTRRSQFDGRARPVDEHAPRRGSRLRDRPGAPGSRAHPPLHARRRHVRTRAGADDRQGAHAHGVRSAPGGHGRGAPPDRRVAHRDRADCVSSRCTRRGWSTASGARAARSQLAQLKVAAANTGQRVLDRAIQVHGAAGLSQDLPLAQIYAGMRALRFGDGPDEVHRETIAKLELKSRIEHAHRPRGDDCNSVSQVTPGLRGGRTVPRPPAGLSSGRRRRRSTRSSKPRSQTQSEQLDEALENVFEHIPWLLRGPVRRLAGT